MKKKFLAIILAGIGFIASKASAFDQNTYYTANIATDSCVISRSTWVVDLNVLGMSRVSWSTQVSTVQTPGIVFYDGRPSTGALTISSNTALAAATSFITVTITSNSALAATTAWITITVTSNTALTGARIFYNQTGTTYTFTEGKDWTRNGFSTQTALQDFSSATAVSLANAMNFSTYSILATTATSSLPSYMSTGTAATVIIRAITAGKYANVWQITSSTQFALTVAYSTFGALSAQQPPGASTMASNCVLCSSPIAFTGGGDPAFLRLMTNATYQFVFGKDFPVDPLSSTATAVSLAQAMNFSSYSITASTTFVAANMGGANFLNGIIDSSIGISTNPNVVIIRAIQPGKLGNTYVLQSSTQFALVVARSSAQVDSGSRSAWLWPGTSNFIEGRDAVKVEIASEPFTAVYSTQIVGFPTFQVQSTSSGTAAALSDAMMSVYASSQIVQSTWTATGVLQATATYVVTGSTVFDNRADTIFLFTSSQAAIQLSTVTQTYADGSARGYFMPGFATQIDTFTFTISTGNRFVNGMAVWFSTAVAGTPPPHQNLVSGSTFFIMNATPKSFQLALTSTGAYAGIPIVISTQAQPATKVGNAFQVVPTNWNGATNVKWQRSNDGNNWFDIIGSSFTIFNNTLMGATTYYDDGYESARFIRETVDASTNTPVSVPSTISGKR